MATVVRVFGVARAEDAVRDVRTVQDGALAALVEDVPADEWSADAAPARLEDLRWLEVQARRHDAVLRAHLPQPVVPFPMTTVFTDDDRVREMLEERRQQLTDELNRVVGRIELGVVVHVDRDAAARRRETSPAGMTGADYIAGRLRQRQEGELARLAATTVADEIHRRLSALAADAVRGNPRPEALDDDPGWNVLNASYLVPLEQVEDFDAEVRALHEEHTGTGTRVRRTGPWAPFHFVGAAR